MIVSDREVNQLLIDKLGVADRFLGVVYADVSVESRQPVLSSVSLALVEGQVDCVVILRFAERSEPDHVALYLSEVFLCLSSCRGTQTFVILDLAPVKPFRSTLIDPSLKVSDREKALGVLPEVYFDDRRHKLLQEPGYAKKTWPVVVQKVDEETLDVTAVMVLIGHDHDRAISQVSYVCVLFTHEEAHDFDEVLQLNIHEDHIG